MFTATINRNSSVGGKAYPYAATVSASKMSAIEPTFSPAKTGSLTTRGGNTSGTLTLATGHGVTTGALLDVYWAGGCRLGMTVGSVSGQSVPVSGGAGDNLPVLNTAVTAMVPLVEDMVITGNDVVYLAMFGSARGAIVLTDASDTVLLSKNIGGATGGQQSYVWASGDSTNPVASTSIAKIRMSHSDSAEAAELRATLLHN